MSEKSLNEFKYSCRIYLSTLSIGQLRSYGRNIGVAKSTTMKKEVLVEEIISVLSGEKPPISRSRKGAPVKNEFVEPEIPQKIEKLRIQFLSGVQSMYGDIRRENYNETARRIAEFKKNKILLRVESPEAENHYIHNRMAKDVYRGQLETLNNVPLLLSLNCEEASDKIIIPIELIRKHDLRQGDIVSCFAEKSHTAFVATEILTINETLISDFKRQKFEECDACYATKRINVFDRNKANSVTAKYLQWILPLGCGQRGCIVSSPKAGKTNLLYEIVRDVNKLNNEVMVLVLLIDQSPENVTKFRKLVPNGNLVYTTYDDEPERQVFVADFLLKRAKRLAESGRNVFFVVDSLSELAHAFNETEASSGGKTFSGGLESKTLQYIKKYFGAARCLEGSGSLTMIGTVASGTGNPADELIAAELTSIDNLEIRLDDRLSLKRIYPAIDIARSQVKQSEFLFNEQEKKVEGWLRNRYFNYENFEILHSILEKSSTYEDFIKQLGI